MPYRLAIWILGSRLLLWSSCLLRICWLPRILRLPILADIPTILALLPRLGILILKALLLRRIRRIGPGASKRHGGDGRSGVRALECLFGGSN